jgi:hypothetical protein
MLAVQKQDKDQSANAALTASGFAKVLSSIQGLQQRLGDFSYGEVSIAEAKVKLLVKQLSLLRDNLTAVAKLKGAVSDTNRQISDLPEESFDLVELDSLEKHPQLHAILRAGKLIRAEGHAKKVRAGVDRVAVDRETDQVEIASSAAAEMVENDTPEASLLGEKQKPALAPASTKSAPLDTITSQKPNAPLKMNFDEPEKNSPAKQRQTPAVPSSAQTFPAKLDQEVNRPADWTFDFNETPAEPLDFEFPVETETKRENPHPDSPSKNLEPAMDSESVEASNAGDAGLSDRKVKAPANLEQPPSRKPLTERAVTKIDESKALVPIYFDQRLLEDVIKNYGDFAASPNLPATIKSPSENKPKPKPRFDKPKTNDTRPYDEPPARPRNVAKNNKAGDLDRQLKKIIKDYGEYDLYQRHSVVNLKTGGIAAFVVLGLVLAGLYLFGSPSTASPPSPPRVAQPQQAERPTPAPAPNPMKANTPGAENPAKQNVTHDNVVDPATVTEETP